MHVGQADYEEAVQLLSATPSLATFVGPREESLVASAEAALGFPFPPSYRRFVLEHGAGGVGSTMLYGVTTDDFTASAAPNAVWLTLDERQYGLSDAVVIVGASGMGEWYVLDGRRPVPDGELPVAVWPQGYDIEDEALEVVASDFGTFFLAAVRGALDDR